MRRVKDSVEIKNSERHCNQTQSRYLLVCKKNLVCQILVYMQTDIVDDIFTKIVTFPVKFCQTNFYQSEAGFFISNVFLHGSCISYKSCNEKTTKISSSLLFKREERGKVFVQQKLQNCWEI